MLPYLSENFRTEKRGNFNRRIDAINRSMRNGTSLHFVSPYSENTVSSLIYNISMEKREIPFFAQKNNEKPLFSFFVLSAILRKSGFNRVEDFGKKRIGKFPGWQLFFECAKLPGIRFLEKINSE